MNLSTILRPGDRLQVGDSVIAVVRVQGQAVRLEIATPTNTKVRRLGVDEAIEPEMGYLRHDEGQGEAG